MIGQVLANEMERSWISERMDGQSTIENKVRFEVMNGAMLCCAVEPVQCQETERLVGQVEAEFHLYHRLLASCFFGSCFLLLWFLLLASSVLASCFLPARPSSCQHKTRVKYVPYMYEILINLLVLWYNFSFHIIMKQAFPESGSSAQELQRLLQHPSSSATHHHHPHHRLHPSDIYPDHSSDHLLHRKSNSISSINSIRRPTTPNIDQSQYLPRRRPTLSHDSSSKHLLALRATIQDPLIHHSHDSNPIQQKPRSNSVSINPKPSIVTLPPTNQAQLKPQRSSSSLRARTPVSNEPPSTQALLSSLNLNGSRSSSSLSHSAYYQPQHQHRYLRPQQSSRSNFVPLNVQHHSHQSIGSIKNSLVDSINSFPCSLDEKLFFVAKLHAEVEAELTRLDAKPNRSHNPSPDNQIAHGARQEMDDPIHLIKLSDRIKALAVSQLKQDLYR